MKKNQIAYVANYVVAISAGLLLVTGIEWLYLPLVPAALIAIFSKIENKKEKEKLQEKANQATAISMLIPFVILVIFLLVWLLIPGAKAT
jgi:predicted RND superfamily exporter protein